MPNFKVAGDYNVKVTYQGNEFTFAVKVYSPLEFKHDADFVYTRAADLSKHVWMREVNADGTATEWANLSNNDFARFELKADTVEVELDMLINNVQYNYVASFAFDSTVAGISVSQFKQGTVGESYYINGYVVAITTTIACNEVIVADKATGEVISVRNVPLGGKVQSMDFACPLAVGDEVVFPVTLGQAVIDPATPTGDCDKLFATYTGGSQLETAILTQGNTAPIDYSSAVEVTTQAQLKSLLSSSNRAGNVYKLVHLKGEMGFVLYASSRQIRFWFMDGKVTGLSGQKIDGNCSPVFCDGTQYYTTGKTFSEMVLGDKSFSNTSYSTPTTGYYDIYALFIGGNNYYHKFVILSEEDAGPMQATMTNQVFTAPTVNQYLLNNPINLTGATITRSYDIKEDEVIPVTVDMLDATSYNMAQAGTYTVTGSYDGFAFSFEIQVTAQAIASIAMASNPTKTTYTHRDGLATLDLTGGKVRVNYSDGTYEDFDLDASMLPPTDENWAIGTVNYTVTYFGFETTLAITYQNTALTISQVLQNTPDAASTAAEDIPNKTYYEVTGVVVDAVTSYAAAELLIKEKDSNVVIGVWSCGTAVVGSYNALKLGTDIVNVGDEIVFTASLEIGASDTSSYGMRDKVFLRSDLRPEGATLATAGLKILSRGNSVDINLTDNDVTVITNATEYKNFLKSSTRYYSYVKFVNVQAYKADSANYNLCYGKTAINVTNIPGRVALANVANFASYLSGTPTTAASGAVETTHDFYMLFLGGNSKAHHFTILQSDWILPRA